MKAIIDEGVPRRLAPLLRRLGADASGFPADWKGLANGRLLDRVESAGFGCLITCDRNLRHQQAISGRSICVIVLPAQRFEDLEPYTAAIIDALATVRPGTALVIAKSLTD